MLMRLQSAVSLFTCSCLVSVASAAPANIGLVMTTGSVQVNGSSVRGNSALFSGNILKSEDASTSLQFADGTNAIMKPDTTMQVYREHSILQKGIAMQRGLDKHAVLADGLRISGATPNAVALIGVKDATHLEVAAQTGETDVWTSAGNLVARVEPGKTLSFDVGAAAGAPPANGVKLHGILRPHNLLTDDQTNVTYQLQGSGLEPLVGASVEVSGTVLGGASTSATPAVVAVSNAVKLNSLAAMGEGQQGGAAPSANAPIWNKSSIIFLIIVAIGGTLLGLAAAGELGNGTSSVTPTVP